MFSFFEQVFIVLFTFSSSLATKYLFLNDEPCMVNGSCNALSSKECVPKETKGMNVTAFNMMTNIYEAEEITEHISCDSKCKFNNTLRNSNQNGIIKHVNVNVKTIISVKEIIIVRILVHVLVRIENT